MHLESIEPCHKLLDYAINRTANHAPLEKIPSEANIEKGLFFTTILEKKLKLFFYLITDIQMYQGKINLLFRSDSRGQTLWPDS